MSRIRHLLARQVLDSRGCPTVEVEVHCTCGEMGRAIVPSGASTGRAEARELRDQDPDHYDGLSVHRACRNVTEVIAPALKGMDPADQFAVDARLLELDGTADKHRLGANAVLGVSMAVAHAAAAVQRCPLFVHFHRLWLSVPGVPPLPRPGEPRMPLPQTNMISGGLHAGGNLAFQDFLALPRKAADYPQALHWLVRIHRRLGQLLRQRGLQGHLVADEGGYGPRLEDHQQAIELLLEAIEQAGLTPGTDCLVALDVASSHFWDGQVYRVHYGSQGAFSPQEFIEHLVHLAQHYPIASLEDPLHEEAWEDWSLLRQRLPAQVVLIGDDLLSTQPQRLQRAQQLGAADGVLVKMNQVGTITETLQTMRLAEAAGWTRVVSARSGETEDTTLADLAVGTAAHQIKIGSVTRSERLAKYNRLLRIAEQVTRCWHDP